MIDCHNNEIVSIIVPIYNIAEYLPTCIDSICQQTYKNLELILVNDGSTDESGVICDKYSKEDSRIIVLHKENGGLVSARKAGMEIATGCYILNVDGDDWIEPDMVNSMVYRMIKDNTDLVQCRYIDEKKGKSNNTGECIINCVKEIDKLNILYRWMEGKPILGSQIYTKLFKAEIIKNAYSKVPNHMSNGEDLILYINILVQINSISSMQHSFYHYRFRESSLSHKNDGLQLLFKNELLMQYLYKMILQLMPNCSQKQLMTFILIVKMQCLNDALQQFNINVPVYHFSEPLILKNKRIIVYGAGSVGRDYILQLSAYEDIHIVAWVDKYPEDYNYAFRRVLPLSVLDNAEYDYILVAVRDEALSDQIRSELINDRHIKENLIIWKPIYIVD